MVRKWWIVWKSGYKNQATVTIEKPKEYNDSLVEVIVKQDLQPLVDELKYHLEYMTVNNAHRIAEAAQELVEAWEGSNGTK